MQKRTLDEEEGEMMDGMRWRRRVFGALAGVAASCVLGGLSEAAAEPVQKKGEEDSRGCDEIVIEDGQEVCIRTKVVRRVIKKKPTAKKKVSQKKRSKAKREEAAAREKFEREDVVGEGPFLVVDPTAFEIARRSAMREGVAQRPQEKESAARAERGAVSAQEKTPRPGASSGIASGGQVMEPQGGAASVAATEVANEEDHTRSFRVEALTDVPLMIGAGALFETDARIRLRTSLGVMPKGYLRLSNALVERANEDYPEEAKLLVERALDESIVWRSQVGWRPFKNAGFYTHVGYTLLGLRGGASGDELVAAAESFDEDQGELMRQMNPTTIEMASRLHLVDLELGWDFALGEKANLRLGAGWAYTFYSRTRVDAEFDESTSMDAEEIAFFEEVSGKYLDAIYRRFVHPPSLSVAFGLRF